MKYKVTMGIVLSVLLVGILSLAFNVQPAKASETIYIRADGTVEPLTANITSADNATYYFTGNNYDQIVVNRSDIIIDGNGHTLQGSGEGNGFTLEYVNNVTIKNMEIKVFDYGIWLNMSLGNTISDNNITNNSDGIVLNDSSNNTISGNKISANNWYGIRLYESSNNTILGNKPTNNTFGIYLQISSSNGISANNITANNEIGILLVDSSNYDSISGNNITNNNNGIVLSYSSNNTISDNNITNNSDGIVLNDSSNNTISGNKISANNWHGIVLYSSSNNTVYHNKFIGNTQHANIQTSSVANFWNSSYPSGGNYWSNYTDVDQYSGSYQNETGSDGYWDHPYEIDDYNIDHYPIVPEFLSWTTMLLTLVVLTVAMAICKRRLLKTPIH